MSRLQPGGAALRVLLAGALVLLGACGAGAAPTSSTASPGGQVRLSGALTVFAAASLTEAFDDAEPVLEASNPGFRATYSFAGSQQLVMNIVDGAPADVIATADQATMGRLVAAGLVESPRIFARNRLEIAVARGNPRGIHSLADLGRAGIALVLADPSVPAGNFARQVLARAGVTVTPRSLELDVKAALEKVQSGDADAAIVYATDVSAAGGGVDGVVIPDAENIIAVYPIAVVKRTSNLAAAEAFVADAVAGEVHAALLHRGFLSP